MAQNSRSGSASTSSASGGEWWLQQSRLQAQLTQGQKMHLRELHELLEASPDAEKPVNGTTIFGEVLMIAWEHLVEEGVLERPPESTPTQRFREGKEAREAKRKADAESREDGTRAVARCPGGWGRQA